MKMKIYSFQDQLYYFRNIFKMGLVLDKLCCAPTESKFQRDFEDFSAPEIDRQAVPHFSKIFSHPMQPNTGEGSTTKGTPGQIPPINEELQTTQGQQQKVQHRFVKEDISKYYNIGKEIGFGKYGVVRLVSKKSYEKKRFALKSVPREKINTDISQLEQELEILRAVDHPNIINFYEVFVDDNYFHFVTEFCGGGELFEQIIERGRFSESYAQKIIKQILSAIKHLHDRNICHRDLKPENILFESKSREAQVKLIDFGLAKYFDHSLPSQKKMTTRIGTPYYMAPEVLEGSYTQACDMWSLGVITYCLLCGYPPFNAETDQALFRKIKLCDYEFHEPEWNDVSQDAKDFVESLIQLNPEKRLTPERALQNKWINMTTQTTINNQVLTRLSLFKQPNKFQKQILPLLSGLLNSKELREIRDTFSAIDADSSGTITLAELCQAFRLAGQNPPNLNDIVKRVDFDNNGEINYSEFVSGTLDRKLLSTENLYKVFKYLDTENLNYLTNESLSKAFKRKGDFSQGNFDEMMREVDLEGEDKRLAFQQFCRIMGLPVIQQENEASPAYIGRSATKSGVNASTRSNSLF